MGRWFLPGVVAGAAERFGDRPAFVDPDGTTMSYADLHRRSDAVAEGLRTRAGVGTGSVVGLTLASDTAYVVAYLAAAKLGAVAAGVNPRLTATERTRCLDLVEPAVVLADADEVARPAVSGGRPPPLTPDDERPVIIVFTSGTTGQPKAAWFADRQLAAVTRIDVGEQAAGDVPPSVPMLAGTQFAHIGFMTKLAWYLRLGTTTHVLRRWRATDVLDLVERERLPSIGGVAPQFRCCSTNPASTIATCRACAPSSPAEARHRQRSWPRRNAASAPSTRSDIRRLSRAASAPAPRSTPTITRRCTPWAGLEAASRSRCVGPLINRCPTARWARCACAPTR